MEKSKKLEELQAFPPSANNIHALKAPEFEINELLQWEEIMRKQRSRS